MNAELPELHQSLLDPPTLSQLFDDLEACTEVLDVLVKGAPTDHADGRPLGLRDAQGLLERRAVRGMQIRYRWDGHEWRDTLLWSPEGLRIVRMQMPPT